MISTFKSSIYMWTRWNSGHKGHKTGLLYKNKCKNIKKLSYYCYSFLQEGGGVLPSLPPSRSMHDPLCLRLRFLILPPAPCKHTHWFEWERRRRSATAAAERRLQTSSRTAAPLSVSCFGTELAPGGKRPPRDRVCALLSGAKQGVGSAGAKACTVALSEVACPRETAGADELLLSPREVRNSPSLLCAAPSASAWRKESPKSAAVVELKTRTLPARQRSIVVRSQIFVFPPGCRRLRAASGVAPASALQPSVPAGQMRRTESSSEPPMTLEAPLPASARLRTPGNDLKQTAGGLGSSPEAACVLPLREWGHLFQPHFQKIHWGQTGLAKDWFPVSILL